MSSIAIAGDYRGVLGRPPGGDVSARAAIC